MMLLRLIGVGDVRGKVFKALVCLIRLNEGVDYWGEWVHWVGSC